MDSKRTEATLDDLTEIQQGAECCEFCGHTPILGNWISVEDRLPEKTSPSRTATVLLWVPDADRHPIITGYAIMSGANGVNYPFVAEAWCNTGGCYLLDDPTHWQPLPPPPGACEASERPQEA